jgi:hypothetical protein
MLVNSVKHVSIEGPLLRPLDELPSFERNKQKVETQKACQNLIRQIHKLLKRKFEANTCK